MDYLVHWLVPFTCKRECSIGRSDQNVINNIIVDFLHRPYKSYEDPLDVLFMNQAPGTAIVPGSVCISIGSAKSMAALGILYAVTSVKLTTEEVTIIAPELHALMIVKATYDPATDMFEQVKATLGKKIRVSDRTRPNAIQLEFAFCRVIHEKKHKGDKRSDAALLLEIIKQYNTSQVSKCRITSDERDAISMLHAQDAEFKGLLKDHWKNFPVAFSAVPVQYLSLPWLGSTYESSVKKQDNPLHYQILAPDRVKNVAWLKRIIGKYLHSISEIVSTGKSVKVRSMAHTFREGSEKEIVFQMVAVFKYFEGGIKGAVGEQAFAELLSKFYRGALDRELMEKAKTLDKNLTIADFRFVQAAMDYNPDVAHAAHQKLTVASDERHRSEMKLDQLNHKEEVKLWREYLLKFRMHQAETHQSKVAHIEVLLNMWYCWCPVGRLM